MKKSVYSLVLMDDIVAAIDELAYSLHTSRSNLINQILAEKVALITPEQRLQALFDELTESLNGYQHFQIQNQAADHMYSVKSALRYKYNPTIRYSYYINQQNGDLTGQLRIISRTQSTVLLNYLDYFFQMWSQIENEKRTIMWNREDNAKWLRELNLEAFTTKASYEHLARHLSTYIKMLDQGLKLYFSQIEEGYTSIDALKKHYEQYSLQMKFYL